MILRMSGIRKRFGEVEALRGVDFDLERGEVHALVGENGAGKSTLMKILAGVERPSEGSLSIDGREAHFGSVAEAQAHGVVMVYQELALVPHLSIAENLFLGKLPAWVDHRRLRREAGPLLSEVDLDADPGRTVASLGIGEQQLVEIARALVGKARILVLDEPTAALSAAETARLFRIIDRVRAAGVGIIYISHRLEEIFEIADRVTVLRDGTRIGTHERQGISPERVVEEMVGRSVRRYSRLSTRSEERLGRFEATAPGLEPLTLELYRGEIVGLAGVVGSGRAEVLPAIFGLTGRATLDGERIEGPRHAIDRGMFLVPGDRKGQGLVLPLTVRHNLALAILPRLQRLGFVDGSEERREAEHWIDRLSLRPRQPAKPVSQLSGGNQQKVVVGKGLATEPRILLMEEPTRGVDVGARSELYAVIDELAAEGLGLVLSSSDTEELIGLCDRILVFRQGRVERELEPPFSYEEVVARVTGAAA